MKNAFFYSLVKHQGRVLLCAALAVVALGIFATSSGCIPKNKEGEVLAPRGQLILRARTFNRFLRWKSYVRAKQLVIPKQRSSWMLEWERNRPHIRITDFQVRDVTETKKGKKAIVLVVIHRHRLPSVSIKRVLEQQEWESKGGYWYFVGIKEAKDINKSKKKPVTRRPSSRPIPRK